MRLCFELIELTVLTTKHTWAVNVQGFTHQSHLFWILWLILVQIFKWEIILFSEMPKICFFSPQNKLHNNQSHAAFFSFIRKRWRNPFKKSWVFTSKYTAYHSKYPQCVVEYNGAESVSFFRQTAQPTTACDVPRSPHFIYQTPPSDMNV